MRKYKLHINYTILYKCGHILVSGGLNPGGYWGTAVYPELLKWLFLRDGYAEGYKFLLHDFVVLELVIYCLKSEKNFWGEFQRNLK